MIPALFNPSNDMALAANVRQYLPPRRIQQMESDLASLSRFWSEGPWGWSLATRQHYLRMGIPESELPTDQQLALIRRLSSREFACSYIADLLTAIPSPQLVGHDMHFCHTLQPFGTMPLIFKSPWSSSGRGIAIAHDAADSAVQQRIEAMLRTQGGYLVDHFYDNKAVDFAMEFMVKGTGDVEFLGYSVFVTGEHGAYGGNVVASQQELKQLIGADESLLQQLVDYHLQHLGHLGYTGPVGIDMMRLADGRIHPVVEINLRMNMGILALLLYQQGVIADQSLTPPENLFVARIADGKLSIVMQ